MVMKEVRRSALASRAASAVMAQSTNNRLRQRRLRQLHHQRNKNPLFLKGPEWCRRLMVAILLMLIVDMLRLQQQEQQPERSDGNLNLPSALRGSEMQDNNISPDSGDRRSDEAARNSKIIVDSESTVFREHLEKKTKRESSMERNNNDKKKKKNKQDKKTDKHRLGFTNNNQKSDSMTTKRMNTTNKITVGTAATTGGLKLVLLRSIGNAIPPRHRPEQTLTNLRFILEHEEDFPNLEKHWVLNHIIDESILEQLKQLLEEHSSKYTVIPFNWTTYFLTGYNFDYYDPKNDTFHSYDYVRGIFNVKWVLESAQANKNLYVTNQNAARNLMIDIGVREYPETDWILPWDGNCFFHRNAYEDFTSELRPRHEQGIRYVVTYMNRATRNDEMLDGSYRPVAKEEPQVSFHRTAKARFHPKLRYGRRNKVELLQRLNVKGEWNRWSPFLKWENELLGPFNKPIKDMGTKNGGAAPKIGWVTRLSSGNSVLEKRGALHGRGNSREEGMTILFRSLDAQAAERLFNFSTADLMYYNGAVLEKERQQYKDGDLKIKKLVENLLGEGQRALLAGPWSVIDNPPKAKASRTNDAHDYVQSDVDSFNCMLRNTTILGLAYYFTSSKPYGTTAARNIRTWFLDPSTMMKPSFANAIPNNNDDEIRWAATLNVVGMFAFLDAVRIVEKDNFLTETERKGLQLWFEKYLDWLETSNLGIRAYTSNDHNGVYVDIQVVAIASYLNDTSKVLWCLDRARSRLKTQISDVGEFQHEVRKQSCEYRQRLALQGWATLARLARSTGRQVWSWKEENAEKDRGSLLCRAARFTIPFFSSRPICGDGEEIEQMIPSAEDTKGWWPWVLAAEQSCGNEVGPRELAKWFPEGTELPPSSTYDVVGDRPSQKMMDPPPFWNLGLSR